MMELKNERCAVCRYILREREELVREAARVAAALFDEMESGEDIGWIHVRSNQLELVSEDLFCLEALAENHLEQPAHGLEWGSDEPPF